MGTVLCEHGLSQCFNRKTEKLVLPKLLFVTLTVHIPLSGNLMVGLPRQ